MSLQEKTTEKCSYGERLKKLRLELQCEWAELAKKLGLSDSMIYAVRADRVGLSDKALHRLEQIEREVGVSKLTKLTQAAEVVAELEGGSEADQTDLFNQLVVEYSQLKDKMTTVESIIARMAEGKSVTSYRQDQKKDSSKTKAAALKIVGIVKKEMKE